ncbi:MAG: thymidine phosphorylase [Clostridia bacterium]|nr:thymidine phosphorylase [Clostridia bacterium]
MKITDIIEKKKNNKALSQSEIEFFINGVTDNSVADYQTAALLMAICINGMNAEETFFLTKAMIDSGDVIDTSFAGGIVCDKHSTGGVSDTVTPIVVPALAAAGLKVIKMSGRGLSHTGGTIDKMESISGFKAQLTEAEIKEAVSKSGAVIIEQSKSLAPADKILYGLRDVTATVDSIPLIASSIMSKKLASGSDIILLDVKYGSGAFMKTAKQALELAKCMVGIGTSYGKKCAALITSMQQPLTESIGCNLEMQSAVNVLRGEKNDLYTLSKEICARIFILAGLFLNTKTAFAAFDNLMQSGAVLQKFNQIIQNQGGDTSSLNRLKPAFNHKEIKSDSGGYVVQINAEAVGKAVATLGGGRIKKHDVIDKSAGIKLKIRINDYINTGDTVATLYCDDGAKIADAESILKDFYKLSPQRAKEHKLIYAYVDGLGATVKK